ncbi:Npun_F5749 family FMN-dependent PPOX-type flavoprotein [Umezakia ovalisporum]|jgi:PPOX class probable FMN-dependent enzyme|uniref:Pyridoxamine 5'-phosphate oxidase family protein n=2 Tax=Umezakia ovalisporum TaxID=75695 RepID=A0AA43H047_9CYAN|nr:Npun_F5749 family FMN-dependent PPOX-type flavoprotein [Umezakia ovalisporum]MBI1240918.1 pyridoxamine 5'-phosphate oxidase [Nostoc sp. RI_552]MDH6058094.1 pyridoxamine 5'-phosphate oxidase family protein [Umezakia ovalisporum FSS-43]MDH6064674.1 pyridoxamine 5'-phosphate oxidase family protein [Umezakia ovalisporum FSS-62]MDH6066665.1 pyridoxamine 5'-phosphate oxidase family protein [Umezakia ovalisporum APH033B]MDH6071583.1 pyridoxamine 5'-phosphate oxidase family protein [Umezakia ovalis
MSIAPWRSAIARALHLNRSLAYARYLQLATVQENYRPANRTVVFRGFLEDTNQLKFITDRRSHKVNQIQKQPWGEICWYFPKTREQFRLSGSLSVIGVNDSDCILQAARLKTWQELSDSARLQFAWPHPGQTRVEEGKAFEPSPPDFAKPVPNFCLVLLEPVEVDHLELRGEPQNRRIYRRDEQEVWSREEINP